MTTILSDYNKSNLIELLNTKLSSFMATILMIITQILVMTLFSLITMMMTTSFMTVKKYGVAIAFIL
ncbi:hypothetical protein ACN2AU_09160 [Aerococcus viridans]